MKNQWGYGIWLGRCTMSDENFVAKKSRIHMTRTVRRLPRDEQHSKTLLDDIDDNTWSKKAIGKALEERTILPQGNITRTKNV